MDCPGYSSRRSSRRNRSNILSDDGWPLLIASCNVLSPMRARRRSIDEVVQAIAHHVNVGRDLRPSARYRIWTTPRSLGCHVGSAAIWLLLLIVGVILHGKRGRWLLVGAPFALLLPAVLLYLYVICDVGIGIQSLGPPSCPGDFHSNPGGGANAAMSCSTRRLKAVAVRSRPLAAMA